MTLFSSNYGCIHYDKWEVINLPKKNNKKQNRIKLNDYYGFKAFLDYIIDNDVVQDKNNLFFFLAVRKKDFSELVDTIIKVLMSDTVSSNQFCDDYYNDQKINNVIYSENIILDSSSATIESMQASSIVRINYLQYENILIKSGFDIDEIGSNTYKSINNESYVDKLDTINRNYADIDTIERTDKICRHSKSIENNVVKLHEIDSEDEPISIKSIVKYDDSAVRLLVLTLLISGITEADIAFAKSDWCKTICETLDIDYQSYYKTVKAAASS